MILGDDLNLGGNNDVIKSILMTSQMSEDGYSRPGIYFDFQNPGQDNNVKMLVEYTHQ